MAPLSVPPELKPIAGFVQRAEELKVCLFILQDRTEEQGHDEVMRYWCMYHAAQVAMTLSPDQGDARAFMFELLDQLEEVKEKLADNEAVTVDVAGQAYVLNFCDKVFKSADDQDRSGKATKATARNFLAAAAFMEVLASFGELDSEQSAKVKYAKWKAADIIKAFKEGRQPHAGPIDGPALPSPPALNTTNTEDTPKTSTQTNATTTSEEDDEVEAQLLRLSSHTTSSTLPGQTQDAKDVADAIAIDVGDDPQQSPSYPFPVVPNGPPENASSQPLPLPTAPPSSLAPVFPSAVMPSAPPLPSAHLTPGQYPTNADAYAPFSPLPSTALIPPAPDIDQRPRFGTPLGIQPDTNPLATPSISEPPKIVPPTPERPRVFQTIPPPEKITPVPPIVPANAPLPADSFDAKDVSQTQKHCRFAVSALNYDDFAEARKQLRAALALLGG